MSRTDLFTGIAEFLAVARRASFRAAGADLGVTPSAVSQAVRVLETKIGLPLFQRTTRKVALTEAGARLLAQVSPAATNIGEAIETVGALRQRPAGLLRLSLPRIALDLVLMRILPDFRKAFPEIGVEIDVNDASIDITAEGYDAGIRIGEFVARDMVTVKLTPDFRRVVVGAPAYFAVRGKPRTPQDLMRHECIRYRFPSARTIFRWEFTKDDREFSVEPTGSLVVNDHLTMLGLAVRGLGLAYTAEMVAANELASGQLAEVLRSYLPTKAGLFLYYPSRNSAQPKLRAFIDFATAVIRKSNRT
ncbi:MAG: LysR substrate-binding domain-containing protein [Bradyrhizobium sp.]